MLTESGTPPKPQSRRPLVASPETKIRLPYTDTSLCEPRQTTCWMLLGALGLEMSKIS